MSKLLQLLLWSVNRGQHFNSFHTHFHPVVCLIKNTHTRSIKISLMHLVRERFYLTSNSLLLINIGYYTLLFSVKSCKMTPGLRPLRLVSSWVLNVVQGCYERQSRWFHLRKLSLTLQISHNINKNHQFVLLYNQFIIKKLFILLYKCILDVYNILKSICTSLNCWEIMTSCFVLFFKMIIGLEYINDIISFLCDNCLIITFYKTMLNLTPNCKLNCVNMDFYLFVVLFV